MIRSFILFWSVLLSVVVSWHCTNQAGKDAVEPQQDDAQKAVPEIPKDSIFNGGVVYQNTGAERKKIRLEDGTDIVMSDSTTVSLSATFNKQSRDCLVDGEVFFHVARGAGKPFVVHTRNLRIFVLGTRFRVDAYSNNAGEEIDLYEGKVRVQKSYHSTTDNEPETLTGGEMVMINRDIDLMEKEKMDSAELKKWNPGN